MRTQRIPAEGVRVAKEDTGVYRISFDPGNSWDRAVEARRSMKQRSRALPKRLCRRKRKLLRQRLLAPTQLSMSMTIWDNGNAVVSSGSITANGYMQVYP